MAIRPLTLNELEKLKEVFKKEKWQIKGKVKDSFRYSIKQENLILFTLKFPLKFPDISLNVPYEIANFKVSIAFKIWHLNNNSLKIIVYIMRSLKELASQVSLKPSFSIGDNVQEFLKLLNKLIPETFKDENERSYFNRIRTSLMNKREHFLEQFREFDNTKIKDIVQMLDNTGLKPTFNQPWELKMGLPKIRTSETLLFSNEEEEQEEFFILEKGYITYFKDIEYNKIYIRSFFECYNSYILFLLFNKNDDSDFKFESIIKNWIKLSRIFLNSALEIISEDGLNQNEFINFKPEVEFDTKDFEGEQCNFPLSALNYESSISKELFEFHNNLFDSPPTHFELIESSLYYYTKAESFIRQYQFEPATRLLNEALKIFNKYRQKKAVVSVLLLLRKIASLLNNLELEHNYLENALNITKSGQVPITYIIEIHYKLGKVFYKLTHFNEALNHMISLLKILKRDTNSAEDLSKMELDNKKEFYLGMAYIYIGLIYLEQERIADSKINLKKAYQIGSTSLKVKLKFHLYRSISFKKRGKISQAIKLLTMALTSVDEVSAGLHQNLQLNIYLELADIYVHSRKNKNKAINYLEFIETRISTMTIPNIQIAIRWNLLMSDFSKIIMKNQDNFRYYLRQSQNLSAQLLKLGVKEKSKIE